MAYKFISILVGLLFNTFISWGSIEPCVPVYPFIQTSPGSNIVIESIPFSPYDRIRQGETRVYKDKTLLYTLDFYLFGDYVIADSTGLNLVTLNYRELEFYHKGQSVRRYTIFDFLTKSTLDSLEKRYLGLTDVSPYFLKHGIPVCEIANSKKKKRRLQNDINNLWVNDEILYFKTIENKTAAFDLASGRIVNENKAIRRATNAVTYERVYRIVNYPKIANIRTSNGTLFKKEIANLFKMDLSGKDSYDLRLIFHVTLDNQGRVLPSSDLNYFVSTDQDLMEEIEKRQAGINAFLRKQVFKINLPENMPKYQFELVIDLDRN